MEFTGTTVYTFDTLAQDKQGWVGDGTVVARSTVQSRTGGASLAITRTNLTVGAVGQVLRADDAGGNTRVVADGDTWSAWVLVPAGTGGAWRGRLEVQTDTYQWIAGDDVFLTPGTWAQLLLTPTADLWSQAPNPVNVQVTVDNPTSTSATVYLDDVAHGFFAVTPPPPEPEPAETVAAVDLTTVHRDLGPLGSTFAGVCSSTYGRRPSTSPEQAAAERALDARFWRLPVRWDDAGFIASSALGNSPFSIEADIAMYASWGHRMVLVIAGRGGDFGTWQAGDAAKIVQRLIDLGHDLDLFDFSGPNEPGIDGSVADADKTPAKVLERNQIVHAEVASVLPGRKLWGPVHFMYNRPELNFHQSGMGSDLAGTNYHHYAMGGSGESQTTAWAFDHTATYEAEVLQLAADAAGYGVETAVNVDEFNWAVKPNYDVQGDDGYIFPGDGQVREARLFRAENTIYIASVMGRILRAGGRGMVYATQNKSLGVMVENDYDGDTANLPEADGVQRPNSSPMPAYWGVAVWTGGAVPNLSGGPQPRSFPHMARRFFTVTTDDPLTEVYAVDNEEGGYNLVVINKRADTPRTVRLNLTGVPAGWEWERHRTRKTNPYDGFVKEGPYALAGDYIDLALDPCTVSVVVLRDTGVTPPADPAPTVERTLPTPFFGVFNADTATAKQDWSAAGGTHVVIAARWGPLEPTQGALDPTALADLKQQLADAAAAGLEVIWSFSYHYPPAWFTASGVPRFKAQNGVEYTGVGADGNNVMDFVFSQQARDAVAAFQQLVWDALTPDERAQIRGWRVGGGPYGELHYPQPQNGGRWWGYSAPAQTGTGLAAGMDVCPVPGHVPFTAYSSGGLLSSAAYSMEPGITAWEPVDPANVTLTAETGIVDQGTQSLRITRTGTTGLAQARLVQLERPAIAPGEVLNVRARLRNATSGRNGAIGIQWWNGTTLISTTWGTTTAISSTEWRPVSVSDISPDGVTHFGIVLGLAPDQASSSQPFLADSVNAYIGASPDVRFTEWYLDSLTRYMLWQIDRVRALGFRGSIHVLHPSFGLRSNFPHGSTDYVTQAAEGVDWPRQVAAYPDAEVWPQGTWANQEDPWDPEGDQAFVFDSDRASWRKLLEVAQTFGRAELLAGENTGGSDPDWDDNTDIDRMFSAVGAYAPGRYQGLTWLNYPRLAGEVAGDHATLARLSQEMTGATAAPMVRVHVATYTGARFTSDAAVIEAPAATAAASSVAATFGLAATVRVHAATYTADPYTPTGVRITPPAATADATAPLGELRRWVNLFAPAADAMAAAGGGNLSSPTIVNVLPGQATATAMPPLQRSRATVQAPAARADAPSSTAVVTGRATIAFAIAEAFADADRTLVYAGIPPELPDDAELTAITQLRPVLTSRADARARLTTKTASPADLTGVPQPVPVLTTTT